MIIKVLQIIIVVATILTGLISLVNPRGVEGFTGLTAPGGRGVTEIRSILGGVFIGLGIAVLLLGTRETYQMLGITYLAIGAVRFVSIFLDRSSEPSNWISLAVEIIFGILLLVPHEPR
ncbi:MAG: DUF4345 family protein [Anaerolineales bacterium]|nr:DUF4345 family protein [Anaerolineales bacterium]